MFISQIISVSQVLGQGIKFKNIRSCVIDVVSSRFLYGLQAQSTWTYRTHYRINIRFLLSNEGAKVSMNFLTIFDSYFNELLISWHFCRQMGAAVAICMGSGMLSWNLNLSKGRKTFKILESLQNY